MIEIHKGKCCGIIGLLHGNNSNEKKKKKKISDSFRGGVGLIDKTLMSFFLLKRIHCLPEKALSQYKALDCEMNVEQCCPSVEQLSE